MSLGSVRKRYRSLISSLYSRLPADEAAERAIGGEFVAFGILERELLIQYGLKPDDYIIDVGCGSGRLANALTGFLSERGRYLGIDLVPELLSHARALVAPSRFRFQTAAGLLIPEGDSEADFVCFFSVFTHLYLEQSYKYLTDARRVLKPTGRIAFSFLEFRIPCHWDVFSSDVEHVNEERPPNVFLSREAIEIWAGHLGLKIVSIDDCLENSIPLPHPITLDDGRVIEHKGSLGQTVCILEK
ncbi:MAG TPA: class I SAM-dependent methyltransferase [Blastocatellia bacterium]|nr:class I SAM-dependent methyltransferase [Blastocatellia bacterium]